MLIHGGRSSKNYMNPPNKYNFHMGKTFGPAACRLLSFGLHISAGFSPYTVPVEICSYNGSWLLWDIIYSQSPRPSYLSIFFLTHLNPGETQWTLRWCLGMLWPKGMKWLKISLGQLVRRLQCQGGDCNSISCDLFGRSLKELGWKGGKNIQSYFGVHHGFWPIDKLVPKA